MKIAEAISKVDALKPTTYSSEDKVEWLSSLDSRVKSQIIDAHECNDPIFFYGYDRILDHETELLVPAPYDEMYLRWLEAMIDYYWNSIQIGNVIISFPEITQLLTDIPVTAYAQS